jgi:hypothetical protein
MISSPEVHYKISCLGQDITREPDPKHLEPKHKTTRKTATHERSDQTDRPHAHTHTLTHTASATSPDRRTMSINRRHRPRKHDLASLSLRATLSRAYCTVACGTDSQYIYRRESRRRIGGDVTRSQTQSTSRDADCARAAAMPASLPGRDGRFGGGSEEEPAPPADEGAAEPAVKDAAANLLPPTRAFLAGP